MTIALGYTRVSTDEQADSGLGLEAQEATIRAEAHRRGWTLHSVIRDEGVSGKDMNRTGFRTAAMMLAAGQADLLLVAKMDRVSRSSADVAVLVEWLTHHGCSLLAVDMGLDTTTPMGKLMANMLANLAEWERSMAATRTKEALAALRRRGKPISRPAVADVPWLAERINLARVSGQTWQKIADGLNDDGIPTLRGGERWRVSAVQSVGGYRRPPAPRKGAMEALPTARPRRKRAPSRGLPGILPAPTTGKARSPATANTEGGSRDPASDRAVLGADALR